MMLEGLYLKDFEADEISLHKPLFGNGVDLNFIYALELSVSLDRKFGVRTSSDDDRNPETFALLPWLTAFVAANRSG